MHPAYGQGGWLQKVIDAAASHLFASSTHASDWSEALDTYEGFHAIPLMTIHKSKGLEYHTVIFVGLDDGAWWSFAGDQTEATAGFFVAFPRGFDLKAIRAPIGEGAGVTGVHDLHLWSVAGDDASLTAHVAVEDRGNAEAIRRAVTEMLEMRFAIHHATIQTETEPCGDEESLHK